MTPSFSRLSRSFVALSALALFGLGCGAPGVKVSDNGSTFEVQGNQNDALRGGENITIPDNFPADLPRYANATTKLALKDKENYTLSQQTTDDTDTVVRNLDQQLTQNGYTLTVRIGNVGEPVQIIDYGSAAKQQAVRIQVSQDTAKHQTMIMIVRVPKVQ